MAVIRGLWWGRNFSKRTTASIMLISKRSNSHNGSKNVMYSDLPDAHIPQIPIDEFVFSKTDKWPNLVATECAVSGQQYTFDEIRTGATYFSRALRKKLKLQKGDVLAVLLPNCPQFFLAALGALKAGLTVTTLNPVYTPDEISRQLSDSGAVALITLSELFVRAKKAANLTKKSLPILTIQTGLGDSTPDGAINFDEFLEKLDFPDAPPASVDDIAFMPYSSGTTGLPKGVVLSHGNVVSNICQFDSDYLRVVHQTTNDHQDVHPAVLPMFHIYGLIVTALHPLEKGAKTVTLPKFTPELYLSTLRNHRPDVLFVAPPIVLYLAGHREVRSEDLQSVRTITSGAAPLGALDEERFLHKAQKPINMFQGYGLTETSPVVAMTRTAIRNLPGSRGSIGRPICNTCVKIVAIDDPTYTPLGPHQTGELLVKGPQVMQGYHNRPEETKAAFTPDGWFRTGDLMHYNDDHLLFVTDRVKELIKVKGYQVAPAELEEIIRDFPEVEDAAVIGVPHETQGEVPRAYVVQKNGKSIDVGQLQGYMKEKVAHYKQLRGGVEVVDCIPKNAAGKILRRVLKLQYQDSRI